MEIINIRKPIVTCAGHLVRVINPSVKDCDTRIGFVGKALVTHPETKEVGELAFSWDNSGRILSCPDNIILSHWGLDRDSMEVVNYCFQDPRKDS